MLFLLLLCLTGLPLIFRAEIDALLGYQKTAQLGEALAVDDIVKAGEREHPDKVVQFVVWEPAKEGVVTLSMGSSASSDPQYNEGVYVEASSGRVFSEQESSEGPMGVIFSLHSNLFIGTPGALLLGLISLIFLLSLISGALVYGPFMRHQRYGQIRQGLSKRGKELDRHKFVGATVFVWMTIIGITGFVNGWGQMIFQLWRMGQLATVTAEYEGLPPPTQLSSVDTALRAALTAVPDSKPYIVAFPGSLMSSQHHYGVFVRGTTAQTEYRILPALIDAATGELTAVTEPPWYIKGLVLSQPLHFGDYAGLPLKVLWAMMDLLMIYLLANGLYLWITRKKGAKQR